MKMIAMTAVVLGLAAPAIAQNAVPVEGVQPAAPAQPATPAQPAPAQPTDPADIIKNEFPVYDKDGNGQLSKAEFSTWLTALKAANPQKTTLTAAQEAQWLEKSFKDADKDKSTGVNLAELTSYLTQKS